MDSLRQHVASVVGRFSPAHLQHRYQLLRQHEVLANNSPVSHQVSRLRFRHLSRWNVKHRAIAGLATLIGVVLVVVCPIILSSGKRAPAASPRPQFAWQHFPLEKGYLQGLRKLVPPRHREQDDAQRVSSPGKGRTGTQYPDPVVYDPYSSPPPGSQQTIPAAEGCFLDEENTITPPVIWAYNGVPERAPEPMLGSHDVLGLNKDVCFDRYGRYGAYGLGYHVSEGGTGLGIHGDMDGTDMTLKNDSRIDWRGVDLGRAQRICGERNRRRFSLSLPPPFTDDVFHFRQTGTWPAPAPESASSSPPEPVSHPDPGPGYGGDSGDGSQDRNHPHIARTAIVLRLWDQYTWTNYSHLYIRSLVTELNLNAGAAYDIHLLIQIKDGSPIWASPDVHDAVLDRVVPREYRSMATLWSEDLLCLLYPGPFEPQFDRPGPIHSVGRSMHMALQWFAAHHPEYDFFWNWEMDIRYIGHWYELFDRVDRWSQAQPREGLWERTGRFYIPSAHQGWESFANDTATRARNHTSSESDKHSAISGPQTFPGWEEDDRNAVFGEDYRARLGLLPLPPHSESEAHANEPADYITFLPQFQPAHTFWIFRADVSGYSTALPIPPRRTSIVTASRFSRRLLSLMHRETALARHSMAGEMFPASIALHYGLKAAFAPHPMYFDRRWNESAYIEDVFNGHPVTGEAGGYSESVFSEALQHNFRGGTYYYDAAFAGRVWRTWLGYRDGAEGGGPWERDRKESSGRMCWRSVLLHPVKWEEGDVG
ncbi:hypothetical protein G647_05160 [Cladophialophora carrionii CBS 160.54]|uniref:Glycosyl transferase CAP10 domain-containing protein n=1 Tax=Cladophialophora carrionii CBS 160.54 TaxID=1279043 RepID=V9D8Y9_9EURO|nr:uncharacterized protein G647_05160 [Cladophialophora carrionii CBS 160.54]ETI23359.1 hypothetical protein G647_05160 [Cladophialophora carrionii CBS 160.54]